MIDQPLSRSADTVNDIMSSIMRQYSRFLSHDFIKAKLTLAQSVVLNMLKRQGNLKMSDIAKSLNISTAAMTGTVDRIVKEGYAQRLSDKDDRRIVRIALTGKGEKAIAKINESRRKMTMDLLGTITPKEREEYIQILSKMRDNLKG